MVFMTNAGTKKPVLDHLKRAMRFSDPADAHRWLDRQGLDSEDFVIWSESDFYNQHRQLIESENKTRQNANMSDLRIFKVVAQSGHTTIVHARSKSKAKNAFCEFFGISEDAIREVEERCGQTHK